MNKELQKLEQEKGVLLQQVQLIERNKAQLIIHIAEVQGIIKYLKGKEKSITKENKNNDN